MDQVPSKPASPASPASPAAPGRAPEAALAGWLVRGRHPWAISWRAAWLVLAGGLVLAVVISRTTRLPRTPGAVLVVGIVATLLLSAVARLAYAAQDRAEARAAAEERLSEFLDTASDLIEITAPDGKLLYANQAWRTVFGYDESEQSTVSTAVTVIPECAEEYGELRRRVLAGEKPGSSRAYS